MARSGVPQISNIENAVRVYYLYPEIGNKEIAEIFGDRHSSCKIAALKQMVREEMINRNVRSFGIHTVNTGIAYEVWGLNIDDLEKRMEKLRKYGMI
ncbi:MAG: hypothetical protein LBI44_07830 [Oscillospiraceae bacterium]|jgi:hypothetical protein|nr:hypothetical protein [Oscillospiraceae bacterium]